MRLIEIEPYQWELYQDKAGMYLNVIINLRRAEYEKTIILDQEVMKGYANQGKVFIDVFAKKIESSQYRNDDDRFYSYPDVTKEQKEKMSEAFQNWVATLDEPYSPYI